MSSWKGEEGGEKDKRNEVCQGEGREVGRCMQMGGKRSGRIKEHGTSRKRYRKPKNGQEHIDLIYVHSMQ